MHRSVHETDINETYSALEFMQNTCIQMMQGEINVNSTDARERVKSDIARHHMHVEDCCEV
jgi:hypothetical protein